MDFPLVWQCPTQVDVPFRQTATSDKQPTYFHIKQENPYNWAIIKVYLGDIGSISDQFLLWIDVLRKVTFNQHFAISQA